MSIQGTVGGTCKVCGAELYFTNRSGVCRDHMHSDSCQCEQCQTGQKSKLRIRTRAELVQMGLLPKQRIF
jgi:predicted amidophosphoribosyltransferase